MIQWAFVLFLQKKSSPFVLEVRQAVPAEEMDVDIEPVQEERVDREHVDIVPVGRDCCNAKDLVIAEKETEIARLKTILHEKNNEIRRLKRLSTEGGVYRELRPANAESDLVKVFKRDNNREEVSAQMTQVILGETMKNRLSSRSWSHNYDQL